jgi:hypothetical protein
MKTYLNKIMEGFQYALREENKILFNKMMAVPIATFFSGSYVASLPIGTVPMSTYPR